MGWRDWEVKPSVSVERCPPLKNYSTEELQKLGLELDDLRKRDAKAVTPGIVLDYLGHRCGCIAIAKQPLPDACRRTAPEPAK